MTKQRKPDRGSILEMREDELRNYVLSLEEYTTEIEGRNSDLNEKITCLQERVTTDDMTGLLKQNYFMDFVNEEISRSLRYGTSSVLSFIDADHFKTINDVYGHQNGDVVILDIANLLKDSVRDVDKVSRYGGEEFNLLLFGNNQSSGKKRCEKIRKLAEKDLVYNFKNIHTNQEDDIRITLSVGLATTDDVKVENIILRGRSGYELFKLFSDGKITRKSIAEYSNILKNDRKPVSEERVEKALKRIDEIGKGYAELCKTDLMSLLDENPHEREKLGSYLLLRLSDEAVYQAKNRGRNNVFAYGD